MFLIWGGGGGQGGFNLPLPVPFYPGSRPAFFGSHPFAIFRLRNIAQCCVIFPFFSRFPPPWESCFPPPVLPPPVHLPPPFLPVSPPVPPLIYIKPVDSQQQKVPISLRHEEKVARELSTIPGGE